jgi:hypothetical protein
MHAYEIHTHEMHACEVHTYEMHAHEMHAREVDAYEMHACETHARDMHTYEIHTNEVYPHGMHARKVWGEISRSTTLNGGAVVDLSRSDYEMAPDSPFGARRCADEREKSIAEALEEPSTGVCPIYWSLWGIVPGKAIKSSPILWCHLKRPIDSLAKNCSTGQGYPNDMERIIIDCAGLTASL